MKKNNVEKLYSIIKNMLAWLQVFCFIYAFSCVGYWFLSLTDLPFVASLEPIFEPTFEYLSNYYNPEVYSPNSVNLIGVLACLVFIIFAIIIHLIREFVESQEELYHINLIKKRKMNDLIAQKQIEKEYIAEMKKYNRFVVLVNFKIQQIKSYLFDDNVDEKELKNIKTSILTELFNSLDSQLISNKSTNINTLV